MKSGDRLLFPANTLTIAKVNLSILQYYLVHDPSLVTKLEKTKAIGEPCVALLYFHAVGHTSTISLVGLKKQLPSLISTP